MTPIPTNLPNPELLKLINQMLDNVKIASYPAFRDLLPQPPKFRQSREVHAARARKLRRRGEYVHFVRWEHGHCIYSWSGPTPETFTRRIGPWQSPKYQPPPMTTYTIETRYVIE